MVYQIWRSHRGSSRGMVTAIGQKRRAIRVARNVARADYRGARAIGHPRQVSVYMVLPGQKRGTLIYQVHFNSKLGRLIAEEL